MQSQEPAPLKKRMPNLIPFGANPRKPSQFKSRTRPCVRSPGLRAITRSDSLTSPTKATKSGTEKLDMIALIIAASLVLLALCFVWFTRKIWFFRDPDHGAIDQQGAKVFSPVYGIVAYIKRIENGKVVSEKIGERIEINEIVKSDWPPSAPNGD